MASSFNKYYQDELTFLDELGKEFARKNPKLAPFLENRGNDPDVERLLEGFAFLSGRLRQKLDDELPELTHTLMALLWPNYLRPVPAMSVLEYQPVINVLTEKQAVPKGTRADSVPVEGTICHFRTCYDVEIYPLRLADLRLERRSGGAVMTLRFSLDDGAELAKLAVDTLRLYLHGEAYITNPLYLWLCRHVAEIRVRPWAADPDSLENPDAGFRLDAGRLRPVGFDDSESVLPYPDNVFSGYRLLQEYFTLPEKFLFIELSGLAKTAAFGEAQGFEVSVAFDEPLDEQVKLKKEHIRLYCTPIVNLFPLDATPITLNHQRVEYLLRPDAIPSDHYEIYAVENVLGREQGAGIERPYYAFESFDHVLGDDPEQSQAYYRLRIRPAVAAEFGGVDTYIAFVDSRESQAFPPHETLSVELTCSNRHLPEELREGDIHVATTDSPEFAGFKNITLVTSSLPPPMHAGLHWKLISNMSLNYISLASPEALRTILSAYNFSAHYNASSARENKLRLEGIVKVESRPADVLHRGHPIRGIRTELTLRESNFSGEGDLYIFASVLNEFFALYASINSFHQLTVLGEERGGRYAFAARLGRQNLV